jgi:hypothetical protein
MAHHYSGTEYGFPHGDARLDLTDLSGARDLSHHRSRPSNYRLT